MDQMCVRGRRGGLATPPPPQPAASGPDLNMANQGPFEWNATTKIRKSR